MAEKENKVPEPVHKPAGKTRRRLQPKAYYNGPVGFSSPLCPLGNPASLKNSLPKDPEKLTREVKPAEDVFVFSAKANPKQKNTRKLACTMLWGDEEDDEQGIKRDLPVHGNGPEQQVLAQPPDEGFESAEENASFLDKTFILEDGLECDCFYGPTAHLESSGFIVSREKPS
ncbi:uncharacterized protein LOC140705577 [Pogona vitticeps]